MNTLYKKTQISAKHSLIWRLAFFLSCLLLCPAGRAATLTAEKQHAGDWFAWVVSTAASPPGMEAIAHKQTLYRQGPADQSPVPLLTQTSTASIIFLLRNDGLLVVQPIGGSPFLCFPGMKDFLVLELPPPWKQDKADSLDLDLSYNSSEAYFVDGGLFYGCKASSWCHIIGFIGIDAKKKQITQNLPLLKVVARHDPDYNIDAESISGYPEPIRIADYIFWRNMGWVFVNDMFPDTVIGLWQKPAPHVFNLKTGELLNLDQVPAGLLQRNRAALADFLKL